MKQLEETPDAAFKDMEDGEEGDTVPEEVVHVLNIDDLPSQVNDAGTDSAFHAHSHLINSGNYSSLMDKRTIQQQPTIYSQLGAKEGTEVPARDKETKTEQSEQRVQCYIQ